MKTLSKILLTIKIFFWNIIYFAYPFPDPEFDRPRLKREKIDILRMKRWILGLELTIRETPDSLPLFLDPNIHYIDPYTLQIPSVSPSGFKVKFYVAMESWNITWQNLQWCNTTMFPKLKIRSLGGTPLDHNELIALCLAYPDVVREISEEYKQDLIAIGSCIRGSGLVQYAVAQVPRVNPHIRMRNPSITRPYISLRNVDDTYSPGAVFVYKVPCS